MNEERTTLSSNPVPGRLPVTMRGPADMAELLPYLLGFFPDDSIVAVGLQGADLQQGGVIRLDIPESPGEWRQAATDTAGLLVRLSEQRDDKPAEVLVYLCRDPDPGESEPVLDGLAPLAEDLRAAFERQGVRVKEALCISGGRWWSFLCHRPGCCEPSGNVIHPTRGPGPVVAAATFAGLAPRGSRKAIVAGLAPIGQPGAEAQRLALERVAAGRPGRAGPSHPHPHGQAGALLDQVMAEFAAGAREIDEQRTALLLAGLQDKLLRDRAAEYAEPAELGAAQRLWRFLAQRCVVPYEGYASAPLTLLAWTSWLAGDSATARIVLAHVLKADPYYLLAQLLYESLNGGLSPDLLLEGVRAERAQRQTSGSDARTRRGVPDPLAPPGGPSDTGPSDTRSTDTGSTDTGSTDGGAARDGAATAAADRPVPGPPKATRRASARRARLHRRSGEASVGQ